MSQPLWGWAVYVFTLLVGVWLVVGALLRRAGIKSFLIPRGGFKRLPLGVAAPFGVGLALGATTNMIPRGPSTHVLVLCLDLVVMCLMIASFVVWMRQKPVIPDSGDT